MKLIFMHFCPAGLLTFGPASFRRFLVEHAPFKAVQQMKDIIDIMYNMSVEILESKKKALQEGDGATEAQVARGKDILSILCEYSLLFIEGESSIYRGVVRENMRAEKEDRLGEDELIAQMS